ncbi:50S ribosomal protein L4 [archaeon]|nr:50S ribosomal protein L4 [archaeon]MBT7381403.1 50S ribosomal protein L4 [archaeon]MBT7507982.1 50S ribosomal protein L4 [archaeon]
MKLKIFDKDLKNNGDKELPLQFNESYHPNLIKRAVLALQSIARQKYGANPDAGMRHSSKLSKRRRKYRGCYGFGISRVNRKILSRRGTRFFWVGTFSPQTRGGRRSHAPKAEKNWELKINRKERRKAIRSAMAATIDKKLVEERGHKIPETYPFILKSEFENLERTKDVCETLTKLGFGDELERTSEVKIRAGRGKSRGRKYRRKKGVLIVVSENCKLSKSANNILGVEVVPVNAINCHLLAPGSMPGRLTLWTEDAIKTLEEKKLFM